VAASIRTVAVSVVAAIVGAVVGWIYGEIHAGVALCLGTWAALAIVTGAASVAWRTALVSAAIFGFAVSLAFLIAGYQGSAPITRPLPLFILLGLFGAGCGGLIGVAARLLRSRFR